MFIPPVLCSFGIIIPNPDNKDFQTVNDYHNWLSRLADYNSWLDTALVTMQKGIDLGFVHPKVIVEKILPQFETIAYTPVDNHLFYLPVKSMPDDFSTEERKQITAQYRKMIQEDLIPRHDKFVDFFKNEYMEASRSILGVDALPSGKSHYQHQVKVKTNTDLSPDSIFLLGESEVRRIQIEMETVKSQVGFDGTLKEFFDHIRSKKELMPFQKPEEVKENFNRIHERIKPKLKLLFETEPKTAFEVKRTEAFREKSAAAQYVPGVPDGSRPGIFYVPIPEVEEYNTFRDESLFLH